MRKTGQPGVEAKRLIEDAERVGDWKRWGPYLSERQWGTVREDYSADGTCWDYLPHDHARSRAYRWGEDGLLGICDRRARLCFALALWNGRDSILKERLFGLSGPEGNHGEDVKECYFYLDSTPTHSYMKALYKYPQAEFPYGRLVEENRHRGKGEPEFELADTGVFDDNRYWDVFAEYAKASSDDVLIRLTVANRGPDQATIHLLPTLWFRNTWAWGRSGEGYGPKPQIVRSNETALLADHHELGRYRFVADPVAGQHGPEFLFTENETNVMRLFGAEHPLPYAKDAFHEYLIQGRTEAVNPAGVGTKVAGLYRLDVPAGHQAVVRLRLSSERDAPKSPFGKKFDRLFDERIREADEFYASALPSALSEGERHVARQACAGLLWTKQFYHYAVKDWIDGDPAQPTPPASRRTGRNSDWRHLYNRDVLSMPDKWEFPWYAVWDSAFHMIPFARIDPHFAKSQLLLFLREWYMHPNGEIPAYEFAFGDTNPPVHAWACWRIYKMSGPRGTRDRMFLARAFQKLLINFTWWVNRKDVRGKHLFSGGFLGLDNIGVFDRSKTLPTGGHLEQADGTAWMAFYCLTMLAMALELAQEDPAYEDVASKFFEHFVSIADAMNNLDGTGLWEEGEGFYYDHLHINGEPVPLKIRSMVGLLPLIAVEVLERTALDRLPGFTKRMRWFLENRQDLAQQISYMESAKDLSHDRLLLAIPSRNRLERVLRYALDESEFLSPYGIRSLSRVHLERPYVFQAEGNEYRVAYVPGESDSDLFGGNSNWRGPVWFPTNYLLIEALERYHHFYGDEFQVEYPTGSGQKKSLGEIATLLSARLAGLFLPDERGARPWQGDDQRFAGDPHWRGLQLFHEYFDGDTGRGCGASHQTGWTALVIRCLEDLAQSRRTHTQEGRVKRNG
ncbi:MAG: glucosidase [Nitrospira sp.]|nr:glucosidase [Nitrospira sp.]